MRPARAGAEVLNTLPEVVGFRVVVLRVKRHEVVQAGEIECGFIEHKCEVFVTSRRSICGENVARICRMMVERERNLCSLWLFRSAVSILVS